MKPVTQDPGPTRRRTPTDEVEAALTAAAHRLLAAEGPAALTVRRVATEAGVAPMGVYNRFGGKEGLVDELFRTGFEQLGADIDRISEGPFVEMMVTGMLAYRAFALANPARYSLMFDRPIPGCDPSEASQLTAGATFGKLVAKVQLGIDAGVVRDSDATGIAQMLWAAAHGAVSLELREIGFVEDRAANFAQMIDALVRGLLAAR